MSLRTILSAALIGGVAFWLAGCGSTTPAGKTGDAHSHDEHGHGEPGHEGHDHAPGEHGHEGHDHSHAHGPHDGHIVEVGENHAEWTHDGKGKVTVYILDKEMKKELPIAAEKIVIDTKIQDKTNTFELEAVNPTEGDMPLASQFEITDVGLEGVLTSLGENVTATLKLTIDKPYEVKITHDDHEHKH